MSEDPPDSHLLGKMAMRETNREEAEEAFRQFHNRHAKYLHQITQKARETLVGHAIDADDLVEEIFSKVWFGAGKQFDPTKTSKKLTSTQKTRAWLGGIAGNLVRDKLKSKANNLPIDSDELELPPSVPAAVSKWQSQLRVGVIQTVEATLNPRDAAVVWFKTNFLDPESGDSKPTPEYVEEFCAEWKIKNPDHIRTIYRRALKTLTQPLTKLLNEHHQEREHEPAK